MVELSDNFALFLELAVSSKSDIVVFNDKTEMKRISLPNSILSVGSNFQDHLIVVQPGVNESQMKVTTYWSQYQNGLNII